MICEDQVAGGWGGVTAHESVLMNRWPRRRRGAAPREGRRHAGGRGRLGLVERFLKTGGALELC